VLIESLFQSLNRKYCGEIGYSDNAIRKIVDTMPSHHKHKASFFELHAKVIHRYLPVKMKPAIAPLPFACNHKSSQSAINTRAACEPLDDKPNIMPLIARGRIKFS
jgi:hypothetical protein